MPRSPRTPGFTLVEFLLVAFLLAVGLLGLGSLQVAVVRARAGCAARTAAAELGNGVLEAVLAEARAVFQAGPGPTPVPRKYTAPEASRWVERFDPEGAGPRFTVSLTRSAPLEVGAGRGGVEARTFRATVGWQDGAAGEARSLVLTRIISY